MTPPWILDVLAAIMLAVAAVSAARLIATRPGQQRAAAADADLAHLLMGISMAGMLTPSLGTLPDVAWEVTFGVLTAWFATRVALEVRTEGAAALAGGHCAPHLVHSASMLYLFLAMPSGGAGSMIGMSGMSMPGGAAPMMTLHLPTLAFLFTLALIGYSVWDLNQLPSLRQAGAASHQEARPEWRQTSCRQPSHWDAGSRWGLSWPSRS